MKYLFIILLLVPALCFSQSKGDTKIIVEVNDTSNLFNRVASYLYEQGYSLQRKDSDAGFIQTDEKTIEKLNTIYKIKIIAKGKKIVLSSLIKVNGLDDSFVENKYTKNKSFYRYVWNEVDKIARHFGSVHYSD